MNGSGSNGPRTSGKIGGPTKRNVFLGMIATISEAKQEAIRDIFTELANHENDIPQANVEEALRQWGLDPDPEQLDTVLKQHHEALAFDDFEGVVHIFEEPDDMQRRLFSAFEPEGGLITVAQFSNVLARYGQKLALEDSAEMIGSVDLDGKNAMTFKEFKHLCV